MIVDTKGLKVIDWEKKGNIVKFYLGEQSTEGWYGDDWNDTPYEHNAGSVYDEFVEDTLVVHFKYGALILEPSEDWKWNYNSPYCKDDMRERKVPILVITEKEDEYSIDPQFVEALGMGDSYKIYMGDSLESILNNPLIFGVEE